MRICQFCYFVYSLFILFIIFNSLHSLDGLMDVLIYFQYNLLTVDMLLFMNILFIL